MPADRTQSKALDGAFPSERLDLAEVLRAGAGEGNRTLVISLEGCRIALSDQHELILLLVRKPAFWSES